MDYEVLFYNGWMDPPAYYPIDLIEGATPELALRKNFKRIAAQVRDMFGLDDDDSIDKYLRENMYALRDSTSLVSAEKAFEFASVERQTKRSTTLRARAKKKTNKR